MLPLMITFNILKNDIAQFIQQHSNEHTLFAALLLLVAALAGSVAKKRIRGAGHASFKTLFAEYATPLIPPALSIALLAIAYSVAQSQETPTETFLFFIRISVAWLAIRFVMLMTSRKSAGWFIAVVIAPITLLELFGLWAPPQFVFDQSIPDTPAELMRAAVGQIVNPLQVERLESIARVDQVVVGMVVKTF